MVLAVTLGWVISDVHIKGPDKEECGRRRALEPGLAATGEGE